MSAVPCVRELVSRVQREGGVVLVPMRSAPSLERHAELISGVCRASHLVGLRERRASDEDPRWRFPHHLVGHASVGPEWGAGWHQRRQALVVRRGEKWVSLPLCDVAVTTGW